MYHMQQQISMIRLDLLIILFTIVLAINHSSTYDGHMNYLHFLATTQSAKWKRTCPSLGLLLQA